MDVTKPCRDIAELLPAAKKACNLFLEECKKAGIDIFITETYRSQARQNYLYEQGRSRSGKKVTWTKNSRHTSRLAWDIAVNKPKDLYDVATLNKAGAIAKKLGITWGGTWSANKIDRPHFEVTKDWTPPASLAKQPNEPKKDAVVIKAPVPSDDKTYRLATGTFPNAAALGKAKEQLKKEYPHWMIYERADDLKFNPGLRLFTGTFVGRNVAEFHAEAIKKKFGWTIYIKES